MLAEAIGLVLVSFKIPVEPAGASILNFGEAVPLPIPENVLVVNIVPSMVVVPFCSENVPLTCPKPIPMRDNTVEFTVTFPVTLKLVIFEINCNEVLGFNKVARVLVLLTCTELQVMEPDPVTTVA